MSAWQVAGEGLLACAVGALGVFSGLLSKYDATTLGGLIHAGKPRGEIILWCYLTAATWFTSWSWRKIRNIAEAAGDTKRILLGTVGWGGAMWVSLSMNTAINAEGGYWVTALRQPAFLPRLLFDMLLTSPIWLWGGFFWAWFTVGSVRLLVGRKGKE